MDVGLKPRNDRDTTLKMGTLVELDGLWKVSCQEEEEEEDDDDEESMDWADHRFLDPNYHYLYRPPSSSISSSPHSNARRRRRNADLPGPGTLQRQLQQLFHLHDSGLDQAFIDALPLFLYKEILGSKEPFDCAVCLCEFAPDDKLRLLPVCGHAFHLGCIDTWLLSNSTCPLCRGAIFVQGLAIENPIYGFDDYREEDEEGFSEDQEAEADERMFSVKLGKFKKLSNGASDGAVERWRWQ
ncbi:hypothetical protein BHM03_00016740 [Ensete ventricosum]|nr:hypothetical protein BHM03_00016740 [Ensete ventricosum]